MSFYKEYFFFIVVALCGCTSIQIPTEDKKTLVSLSSKAWHDKEYLIDDNNYLIATLFDIDTDQSDTLRGKTLSVEVVAANELKLVLNDSQQPLSRIFKGNSGKVFQAKNKIYIGPVPLVFWTFNSALNYFSKTNEGKLAIYHDHSGTIFIGVIPIFGTSAGQSRAIFEINHE